LQSAAEAGDQAELDCLFARRGAPETLRLAILIVIGLALAMFLTRYLVPLILPPTPMPGETFRTLSPEQRERAAIAAAMVANGNPFATAALHETSRYRSAERAATAAALVASFEPMTQIIQQRTAYARYVEIWKVGK
jgi:hypothetical protein